MAEKKTSHVYSQALLELATEPWLKSLRLVNRRLRAGDVMAQLEDPGMSDEQKEGVLAPILSDAMPQAAIFIRALSKAGDLNKLDNIVDDFESTIVRRTRYVLAHVTSAVALTDDERSQLEKNLARRFGDTLEAEYEVDPALIGGVIVRVGDEVIDGSLAGKLSALRERLA